MEAFFDAIDVSTNIDRGLKVVRNVQGLSAFIMMVVLFGLCYILAPWIWFFDLDSTVVWTEMAMKQVEPTLPKQVASVLGTAVLGVTLLPTLVEMFTSRFASAGIKMAGILVYGFSLFDMITDRPRVWAFIDGFEGAFEGLGLLEWPVSMAVKILFLFLASFGFEALFVVFGVAGIYCLSQLKPRGRSRLGF
jgi:hypothetical protein